MLKHVTIEECSDMSNISLFKEAHDILKNFIPKTDQQLGDIISLSNIILELKFRAADDQLHLSLDEIKSSRW